MYLHPPNLRDRSGTPTEIFFVGLPDGARSSVAQLRPRRHAKPRGLARCAAFGSIGARLLRVSSHSLGC
ncbi:MAG: hypothetical protein J4N99_09045, partial [Chloroflexi bacterium]|nr:hypothetical protein [Chloroflexota bacterium]